MAKAMILAAGQGTRVRPLTKYMPKPMIPILGKPVMEYLIEHLARYGVTEIMINVAYSHWKIENYFGNGSHWGVQIGYSFEGTARPRRNRAQARWARPAACARSRNSAASSTTPPSCCAATP